MKTALITGGAGGIGSASAEALCKAGFSVAINYCHSEEKALALSSSLISRGYDAFTVRADVGKASEVDEMFDFIIGRCGSVDVLVNNAGISTHELFDTLSDEMWQKYLDVNLSGPVFCCRRAVKEMLRLKSGSIINISSMWGQTGASCEVAYSTVKAGVIGLTRALAKEVAPSGIRVNCICPGAVDTKMMECYSGADIKAFCEEIPLGRLAAPSEIADAVVFLATEKSSYITGQILGVNGGAVI